MDTITPLWHCYQAELCQCCGDSGTGIFTNFSSDYPTPHVFRSVQRAQGQNICIQTAALSSGILGFQHQVCSAVSESRSIRRSTKSNGYVFGLTWGLLFHLWGYNRQAFIGIFNPSTFLMLITSSRGRFHGEITLFLDDVSPIWSLPWFFCSLKLYPQCFPLAYKWIVHRILRLKSPSLFFERLRCTSVLALALDIERASFPRDECEHKGQSKAQIGVLLVIFLWLRSLHCAL